MNNTCSFCQQISHTFGEVYCSRFSAEAKGNSAYVVQATEAETEEHVARLQLFTVFNGLVNFSVDGRTHILSPGSFLLLNPGQKFRVWWKSSQKTELFCLSFDTAYAQTGLQKLMAETALPLADWQEPGVLPLRFFTLPDQPDAALNQLLDLLYQHTTRATTAINTEALFGHLLERLYQMQYRVHQTITQLGPVKPSTCVELYHRLRSGREFIDANLHRNLSLDDVASEACLSKFHFMRLFKQAFGQTVHQYITARRLSRTRLLLQLEEKSFPEICRSMGYEDVAWFAKVYKRAFGTTPTRQAPLQAYQLSNRTAALAVA